MADRITVNLTERATKALDLGVELTGHNKTDIVNRALTVYAYIEMVIADGGGVLVQTGPEDLPEKLVII